MDLSVNHPKLSFIRRHHVLLKIHYFLYFSAFGVIFPTINLTLRSRGLSNAEISLSNIIIPFLVFITSPLIGAIADKSRRFLLTLNILCLIVIITFTSLYLLPSIKSHHIQANLHAIKSTEYTLDFCTSQEVVAKCVSKTQCGCRTCSFRSGTRSGYPTRARDPNFPSFR